MSACACGCCAGIEVATPAPTANPAGLSALRYRVGTHAAFRDSMLARLSSPDHPALAVLTTREPDDLSIALLDGWATLADVLAFYNERLVNELYIGTATERRSVLALARLVGYEPRPGVAAGTHLAFLMEVGGDGEIPARTPASSLPPGGGPPQTYETSSSLRGHERLNVLPLRMSRPQDVTKWVSQTPSTIWLRGTATGLRVGSPLLLDVRPPAEPRLERVHAIEEDSDGDRTQVWLAPRGTTVPRQKASLSDILSSISGAVAGVGALPKPEQGALDALVRRGLLDDPTAGPSVYLAIGNALAQTASKVRVLALRVTARAFGHNAPLKVIPQRVGTEPERKEWEDEAGELEEPHRLFLDAEYEAVRQDDWVLVETGEADSPFRHLETFRSETVVHGNRTAYGISGPSTEVRLRDGDKWSSDDEPTIEDVRSALVLTAIEELELADEPITEPVEGDLIELDGVVEGLAAGRLIAVSGARVTASTTGVRHGEVARVAAVYLAGSIPGKERPGDAYRTLIALAAPLRYRYERASVTIHGNVVHATHGATRSEVLGSGDASVPSQAFRLRAGPLTYVSAPTASGAESSLELRVDEVRWPRRPWLVDVGPDERGYLERRDDDGGTAVVGGNGRWGRRFPTAPDNARARYRVGIGAAGNTDAGTITTLAAKPLGVKEVVNPVAATGGADPETRDGARRNAPLGAMALDRLVSLSDYRDVARAFGGVGAASADRLATAVGPQVIVTIAAVADAPLDPASDLVASLRTALRELGDPTVPVRVVVREQLLLKIRLRLTVHADHEWSVVEAAVRAELLRTLGFDRREPGQGLTGAEVLEIVHRVPGVQRVLLAELATDPVPTAVLVPGVGPVPKVVLERARVGPAGAILGAQIAYLAPELPELLEIEQGLP